MLLYIHLFTIFSMGILLVLSCHGNLLQLYNRMFDVPSKPSNQLGIIPEASWNLQAPAL